MNEIGASPPVAIFPDRSHSLPGWQAWFLAAALSAPVAIVLHELGHFVVAHAFGFPDVVLRFASISDGAAEAGAPEWQQALKAGAGPLVTLVIVGLCCYLSWRRGPHPWVAAPAFAAGFRSAVVGLSYGVARMRYPGMEGNMDELNFARGLGLSQDVVMALSTLLIMAAWGFLILRIPRTVRAKALLATAAGTGVGLALYIPWLGPMLLP